MVKIIKEAPPEIPKRLICYHCKALLEYMKSDVRRGEFGAMGDYSWEEYIRCPSCKTFNII
mgnify:CR=1 FL=1